jgi:hypothetical protein
MRTVLNCVLAVHTVITAPLCGSAPTIYGVRACEFEHSQHFRNPKYRNNEFDP